MAPEGLPEVAPLPGLRNRICVAQHQIRDWISAGDFAQIPNPGSVRSRRHVLCFRYV
jgi:hypothetical protein